MSATTSSPSKARPGKQQVADLGTMERDGQPRRRGIAEDLARVAVQTRGQIDRDHRQSVIAAGPRWHRAPVPRPAA